MTARINLAIATRERPEGLRALLVALEELDPPRGEVEVVVVDNDPAGSAEQVVASAAETGRWPITYLHEPRVGIAFARNRALDRCEDGTLLAFIDDDELPDPRWLAELEAGLEAHDADIVTGPVRRRFPPATPGWVRRVRSPDAFFERPTGAERTFAGTGNFLARVDSIRGRGLRFDERFPLLGGEDGLLTSQVVADGGRIVWIAEAIIHESVPDVRVTLRWMLRRPFRIGFATTLRRRTQEPGWATDREELRQVSREFVRAARRLRRRKPWPDRMYQASFSLAKAAGILVALSPVRPGFADYRVVDRLASEGAAGPPAETAVRGPRVLHIYPHLNRYGVCRQFVAYIKHASEPQAHHVAVLLRKPSFDPQLPNPPVKLTLRFRRGKITRKIGTTLALRRLVKRLGPDVVHAYNPSSSLYAAFAVPRRYPLVVSRHGAVPEKMFPWFPWVERLCYRRVQAVVAVSEEVASTLPQRRSYPPIHVVYNGVDLDRFGPVPMPEAGAPPTVTMVAQLNPTKRQDLLIRAAALVRERIPDVRVNIVGRGGPSTLERFEALTRSLGLEGNVRFTGEIEDVRPFLAESYAGALISEHEGFGNVLLEAMAMGRPVVASRRGAIPEVVRDGVDGILTELDPADIAAALERLFTDAELRERMGASAVERVERFGWPEKVRGLEAVYRSVSGFPAVPVPEGPLSPADHADGPGRS